MSFKSGPTGSWNCSGEPPVASSNLQSSCLSPFQVIPRAPQEIPLRCLRAAPRPALSRLPIWAGWQQGTGEFPIYPAPGHCDCCAAGRWHSDIKTMGPLHSPTHRCSTQHALEDGLWGAGPEEVPVPRRPWELSLPMVAMHWAELLSVPGASFAIWQTYYCCKPITVTNLLLLLFSQAMAQSSPATQRPLLLAIPLLLQS